MTATGDREDQPRRRGNTWGAEADRAAVLAIAEDVRLRTGFDVCAVEVLRADEMLEFVAIAGPRDEQHAMMGQASPLNAMLPALTLGATYDAFTFVAAEWMTDEALKLLSEYGYTPDLPESSDPQAWRAEDMLVARILDDRGTLRGLLYLDEPVDGQRRTEAQLSSLTADLALPLRAILTAFEREELTHQARLFGAAAEAVRNLSPQTGVKQFLDQARAQLAERLRASHLVFRLRDGLVAEAPPLDDDLVAALDRAAERAWLGRHVVIVEAGEIWGDEELATTYGDRLTSFVRDLGAQALVCLPLGSGTEPMGQMLFLRESIRWTGAESRAALEVGHDLGRAVQLARAFEREMELIAELQRVDARRTEFARTVSHELKNPLTLVTSYVEVLEESDPTPDQLRSIRGIARGARRLEQLINDLSALARRRPDDPEAWSRLDMGDLVTAVVEQNRERAGRQGIALLLRVHGADCVVLGDELDLTDALNNLISNAVKYSDAPANVVITVWREDVSVLVEVRDTGIGVAPDDLKKLFTDFFRTSNEAALRRPGSGLGLAIVRRIVTLHGGEITARSEPGVGSAFTMALPVFSG